MPPKVLEDNLHVDYVIKFNVPSTGRTATCVQRIWLTYVRQGESHSRIPKTDTIAR